MKIAIIGYGRMGKEIEEMALSRSHEIVAIIDNENDWNESANAVDGRRSHRVQYA